MVRIPVRYFSTASGPRPPSQQRNGPGALWSTAASVSRIPYALHLRPPVGGRRCVVSMSVASRHSTGLGALPQALEQSVIYAEI